jgi:uncharacterized protein (DUF4415 family)
MATRQAKSQKQEAAKGKTLLQARVDRDLQRQFKAKCALAGRRMNDVLEEMIRAWVKGESEKHTAAA